MVKQNIVFVGDKAGSLKSITGILAETGINLFGFACFDAPEFGIFRMVCDHPEKAAEVLHENGYMNRIIDVIAVDLRDERGGLDELLGVFQSCNVSLDYIYTSFHRQNQVPIVILAAEDIYESESILESRGFRILHSVDEIA